MSKIKEALSSAMLHILNQRIDESKAAIDSAIESRNTATKSSAGDKHETGRALMQIEIDNQKKQVANSILLKSTLAQIPLDTNTHTIDFGSLVETSQGFFYLSVSLGKVELSGGVYFTVSPSTPLAQALIGAKLGDTITFQNRSYEILSIE
ncbi:GreA/GreB family elongation factor [Cryomorpha ignava]|uniref:GreA/GreB family elongation factor n=1 Tax=Cryomorpha ignava TaxID=101383 RepID=A0A7K3WV12_9FLAO|nr:GreA/GreB family elongation factor [Cryomorpha ignava]NEN25490.1 GreA/GreB family elongation factor [Cryomorpha ignava]